MKVWYSCKIKSSRESEDGMLKQVTDVYLVDAVSYTEAETRMNEQVGSQTPGEWSITNITKTNYSEVINYEDVDTWYKCKVTYATVDGDSEKEIKVTTYYLVSANTTKEAYERVEDNLSSMLVPFEIPSVSLTNIYDVLPYLKDEPEQEPIPDNLVPLVEAPTEEIIEEDEEEEVAVTDAATEEEPATPATEEENTAEDTVVSDADDSEGQNFQITDETEEDTPSQ